MLKSKIFSIITLCILLLACQEQQPKALGTLEWDRLNGRAVSSETITEIYVKEGDSVEAHQALLKLDDSLQLAHVKKLTASVEQARWQVRKLESGFRGEEIASAKAELEAKTTARKNQQVRYQRQKNLRQRELNSQRQLDDAEQLYKQSLGVEEVALQKLKEKQSGYRIEEIEQARANLHVMEAELEYQQLLLDRFTVFSARAGKVDSLPYKLGDKPPMNAVVSTVLAGDRPWARVYIPETWLSQVTIGSQVTVNVDGLQTQLNGTVRVIASEPSFTPYYALSEENRSRLMFIAEIELSDERAMSLPLGIPLQVSAPSLSLDD
jgi:HlyD family secretion protein